MLMVGALRPIYCIGGYTDMPRKPQNESQAKSAELLIKFFTDNPDCKAIAYSPEEIVNNLQHGWPQLAEVVEIASEFYTTNIQDLATQIYIGAYTKFKVLGTAAERLMEAEITAESKNHADLSRGQVILRMQESTHQAGVLDRGEVGARFAASKTPNKM